jgi:hypothetical protein
MKELQSKDSLGTVVRKDNKSTDIRMSVLQTKTTPLRHAYIVSTSWIILFTEKQ